MGVTVVILTLLLRIFVETSREWRRSDERLDTFRDARAAIDIISRDLRAALTTAGPPMLVLDYDPTADARTDSRNQEAYAVTAIPNNGKSDLCTVGYYCVWDGTTRAFTLKRLFKNSDATYSNLRSGYMAGRNPLTFADLYTRTPLPPATSAEDDVAGYIWDLQFTPGGQSAPGTLTYPQTYPAPNAPDDSKWRWIEVRFKAMSPNAAQRLAVLAATRDTWFDPTSALYRNTILPNEQQFVTRVLLNSAQ